MLHLYHQLCECVCPVLMEQSAETVMVITLIPFWRDVANDARRHRTMNAMAKPAHCSCVS